MEHCMVAASMKMHVFERRSVSRWFIGRHRTITFTLSAIVKSFVRVDYVGREKGYFNADSAKRLP
jgi:hypothetical protein